MPISNKHKLLFVHINKTAGRSIELGNLFNVPHEVGSDHRTVKDYIRKLGYNFNTYFSFSIVRNPWDKMVSMYFFRQQRGFDDSLQYEFGEWLEFLPSFPYFQNNKHHYYRNQLDWLVDTSKRVKVNYIIRFENLQEDYSRLLDKLYLDGREYPLLHENKGIKRKKDYTQYYDQRSINKVAEYFNLDIKYFRYEFAK